MRQEAWFCNTCNFNAETKKALCKHCIEECHKGHDVVFVKETKIACACATQDCCFDKWDWLDERLERLAKPKGKIKSLESEIEELREANLQL